jgi:hypothetical protein
MVTDTSMKQLENIKETRYVSVSNTVCKISAADSRSDHYQRKMAPEVQKA